MTQNRTYTPTDKVGAEECYLLYEKGLLGSRKLIGAWSKANDALKAIGTSWPCQDDQILFAVYENGAMREVKQTIELMACIRP
jgi:hypothetical protein